jgi:Tfp pilus assembly protein PilV
MKLRPPTMTAFAARRAFTLAEVMIAVLITGLMMVSLFAGFSVGFRVVQSARENLRATQILLQRMETIRLYTWSQVNSNAYLQPTFTERYDPLGVTNNTSGTLYVGVVGRGVPAGLPAAYQNNMREITVTLYWTNYSGYKMTNKLVRTRSMQTYVARYGMQNYIYGK